MNIQAQKDIVIAEFQQVNDIDLIMAIKSMLEFAKKKETGSLEIPDSHQKIVMDRFKKVRSSPERLLDWETAKVKLKA